MGISLIKTTNQMTNLKEQIEAIDTTYADEMDLRVLNMCKQAIELSEVRDMPLTECGERHLQTAIDRVRERLQLIEDWFNN